MAVWGLALPRQQGACPPLDLHCLGLSSFVSGMPQDPDSRRPHLSMSSVVTKARTRDVCLQVALFTSRHLGLSSTWAHLCLWGVCWGEGKGGVRACWGHPSCPTEACSRYQR